MFIVKDLGTSDEESGETTRVTMKDLGNKMRNLGRYYEGFGEIAAGAAMDMKTKTAGMINPGAP